jgi:hypothetical protein
MGLGCGPGLCAAALFTGSVFMMYLVIKQATMNQMRSSLLEAATFGRFELF